MAPVRMLATCNERYDSTRYDLTWYITLKKVRLSIFETRLTDKRTCGGKIARMTGACRQAHKSFRQVSMGLSRLILDTRTPYEP